MTTNLLATSHQVLQIVTLIDRKVTNANTFKYNGLKNYFRHNLDTEFHYRFGNTGEEVFSEEEFFPVGEWVHSALTYDHVTGTVGMFRNGAEMRTLRRTGWTGIDMEHRKHRISCQGILRRHLY